MPQRLRDRKRWSHPHAVLLGCMLNCAACTDSATNEDDSGAGGEQSEGAGGAGGEGGAASFALIVHVNKSTQTAPAGFENAPGATVAVDLPDGSRMELPTDDQGEAVFVLPTSATVVDVIGYLEGYGFNGSIEIDTTTFTDVPIELTLWRPGAAPTSVFGSAVGMSDPSHTLLVSSSSSYPNQVFQGPDWTLDVEANTSLQLCGFELLNTKSTQRGFAIEHFGWALAQTGPLRRPGEVVLDFSRRLETHSISGTVLMPTGDGVLAKLATTALAVRAYGNKMLVGAPTRVDVSADGQLLEYEASHIVLPGEELITTFGLTGPGGQGASLAVLGTPMGPQAAMLPEAPVIEEAGSRHLHDQIEWMAHPSHAGMRPVLYIVHDGTYSTVRGPFDATHIRVPPLPSTADAIDIEGPSFVLMYDGLETSAGFISGRQAFSKSFAIEP